MDEFLEPYWNLDQVKAWAETRDPQLVRFASASSEQGKPYSSAEIAIRSVISATETKKNGRDLDAELWAASGREPSFFPFDWPIVERARARGLQIGDDFLKDLVTRVAANGSRQVVRREEFPTVDYLTNLLRVGSLTAIANLPGEPKAYEISTANWALLESAVGGEPRRLGVRRIGSEAGESGFENVRVEREQVLKVFPPNPVAAQTASSGSPENAERSSPRQTGAASTGKPSKVTAAAEALARLFPGGRPSHTRDELLRQLRSKAPEVHSISLRTLSRAIERAWPSAEPNRAN